MAGSGGFVSYVFAYTNRRPASVADVNALPAVQAQLLAIERYRLRSKAVSVGARQFDYSTTRKKPFDRLPNFRKAVAMAQEAGVPLVLGGIAELLRRTNADLIDDLASRLDIMAVPVIDAMAFKVWQEIPFGDRQLIRLEAKSVASSRTKSICAGVSASTKDRQPSPARNQKHAVRRVQLNADKRASDQSDFVSALRSSLSPDIILTPSALAKALNDAGVPSARGKTWSFNAAKNLLNRIDT